MKKKVPTVFRDVEGNGYFAEHYSSQAEAFEAICAELADSEDIGELRGRNEERDHLRFLYRWISRLNGDKEHDRPETDWKQYAKAMVYYPLSPWQTGDWFEEPLEKLPAT